MPSSYEDIVSKEVMIRDLLSSFPDTSSLNKTCQLLSDKLQDKIINCAFEEKMIKYL